MVTDFGKVVQSKAEQRKGVADIELILFVCVFTCLGTC